MLGRCWQHDDHMLPTCCPHASQHISTYKQCFSKLFMLKNLDKGRTLSLPLFLILCKNSCLEMPRNSDRQLKNIDDNSLRLLVWLYCGSRLSTHPACWAPSKNDLVFKLWKQPLLFLVTQVAFMWFSFFFVRFSLCCYRVELIDLFYILSSIETNDYLPWVVTHTNYYKGEGVLFHFAIT